MGGSPQGGETGGKGGGLGGMYNDAKEAIGDARDSVEKGYYGLLDNVGLLNNFQERGFGFTKEELEAMPEEEREKIMKKRKVFSENMATFNSSMEELMTPESVPGILSPTGGTSGMDPHDAVATFRQNLQRFQ